MNHIVTPVTDAFAARIDGLIKRYDAKQVSIAECLCDRHEPSQLAFRIIDETLEADDLTYGALREGSERFAAALANKGVGPGDRIATLMGKSRDYLMTLLAIWRLGAVHVPLFTAFATPQIALRLDGSGAKFVVADETQTPKLADLDTPVISRGGTGPGSFAALMAESDTGYPAFVGTGDHPMVHIYTSGTTGDPKGVVMPAKSLASFQAYMEIGMDVRPSDVFWSAADPGWAYGIFTAIFGTLATGVPGILLAGGFSPETTLEVLSKFKVTNFTAAPTVYRALKSADLSAPSDLALRCASSAGEPLTPDVNIWARDVLGIEVHDHYGQTEMGMMVGNHHHPDLKAEIRPGSMGVSLPGFKAGVLNSDSDVPAAPGEVGRLAIRADASPLMWFSGYDGLPKKTAEKFTKDGAWYLTGDVAEMDTDGFVHFSSRDDDVIIMAGYRIGPFEVESTLSQHAAVVESAAVARPDEVRGEVIEAFVVLEAGVTQSEALAKELQTHVKTQFAAHAYPRRVHFVKSLPKTPSGKVQRFLLRRQLVNGDL